MKSTGPSFLATLIALSAGLFFGRVVFPHLDPAAMAEDEAKRLAEAYESRTAKGHALLKESRALAAQLSNQGPGSWPALREAVAKLPNSGSKAAQWSVLTHYAAQQKLPGVNVAAEEQLSPWYALTLQKPASAEAGQRVRKAQDPTLHSLRAEFEKATEPKAQFEAATNLGSAQGIVDPLAGIQWASTLQADSPLRAAAVLGIAEGWASVEPQEAADWAVTLVDGRDREAACQGLARGAATVDPLLVLPWALEIQDPAQRVLAVDRLLKGAVKQDSKKTVELLETAPLPEKERQNYVESVSSIIHGITPQN